jgi:hypothetical protein
MMMRTIDRGLVAMAESRLNAEIAEIVTRVLGDLSLDQASEKINFDLSRTPLRELKRGKVGREETIRKFAEGFWQRLCREYGEEITAGFGTCSLETASDWLAQKAHFGLRYTRPVAPAAPQDPEEDRMHKIARLTAEEFATRTQGPPLDRIRAASRELQYERDPESTTPVEAFEGSNIHPDDLPVLESIAGALEAERRQKQGR